MEKPIRKRNATPSDSDKQLNLSPGRSTREAAREPRGERGGREVAKARKGRKIRHFAPHNMHMPANMNPRDCSPSSGKNVDIRYFTSSSSSLWTFVPAASVSSSSPPGPQRRHRRRRHRIARSTVGSPTARRHRGGRAARGRGRDRRSRRRRPVTPAARTASAFALVVGGRREGGRRGSSSLKLRETSRSAPLDFEPRGSIARLPAKNSSNNIRMPIKGLARGGVAETNLCMQ